MDNLKRRVGKVEVSDATLASETGLKAMLKATKDILFLHSEYNEWRGITTLTGVSGMFDECGKTVPYYAIKWTSDWDNVTITRLPEEI